MVDKEVLTRQLRQILAGTIASYSRRENDEHIVAKAAPVFYLHLQRRKQ
jgi:hypothetical protein